MKHGTAIEWTHLPGYKGEAWNPWVGCLPMGPGCENCWAARQANRFKNRLPQYEGIVEGGKWTGRVNRTPSWQFYAPTRWIEPRAIFPCSMSDFFHPDADEYRESAWHTIYDTRRDHLYLILTKRPDRIPDCLPDFGKKEWPWPHVWLGATVENQEMADKRVPELLRAPAAKRFLSLEPLLEPVDLSAFFFCEPCQVITRRKRGSADINTMGGVHHWCGRGEQCPLFHWVIVGGESGPGARPMYREWLDSVISQCRAAKVPCFVKQLGSKFSDEKNGIAGRHLRLDPEGRGLLYNRLENGKGSDISEWPLELRVQEFPS